MFDDDLDEGVTQEPTSPAVPSGEQVETDAVAEAAAAAKPTVGQEQTATSGAEQQASGTPAPKDEPAPASGSPQADEPSQLEETSEVKRQARKYWAEINEMGGQPFFDAAKGLATKFFNTSEPTEFVKELSQYPARFQPVREAIVWEAVAQHPEVIASEILGRDITAEELQRLRQGSPPAQAEPQEKFDPAAYARQVLEDPYSTEHDKALARHTLATAEQLGKLPQLEEKVNRFDKLTTEQKQRAVQEATGKYLGEVMSVVDRTYKEAGLDLSAQESVRERAVIGAIFDLDPQNAALAAQVQTLLSEGDVNSAYLLQDRIKARIEKIAAELAAEKTSARSAKLAQQSQTLNRDRPTVVTETGQTAFGTPAEGFKYDGDPDDAAAFMREVKQRTA